MSTAFFQLRRQPLETISKWWFVQDLNQPFPQASRKSPPWDLVRVTKLGGCISNWDEFLLQIYQVLKPGAYIELCDTSKVITETNLN